MNNNDAHDPLDALRNEAWNEHDAVARVAQRLDGAHDRSTRARRSRARSLALLLPALLLVGTAVAATAIAVQRARLYDVTVSENGAVLTSPSMLVLPGQSASMIITDGAGVTTTVLIGEDGEATVETDEAYDVEVEVTEIEVPVASTQRLYEVTVFVGDDVIARPSLLVNHGESAEIVIDDGRGEVLTVTIDENGAVHTDGPAGVRVEFDVIEMP